MHEDRNFYVQRLRLCSPSYAIYEAATGKYGLEYYRSKSIDCVVLEIDLPDMSGFEVLLSLVPSALHPKVAVVVLTRLTHQGLLMLATQNGAQAAMHKASTSGDLLDETILQAITNVERDRSQKAADLIHNGLRLRRTA